RARARRRTTTRGSSARCASSSASGRRRTSWACAPACRARRSTTSTSSRCRSTPRTAARSPSGSRVSGSSASSPSPASRRATTTHSSPRPCGRSAARRPRPDAFLLAGHAVAVAVELGCVSRLAAQQRGGAGGPDGVAVLVEGRCARPGVGDAGGCARAVLLRRAGRCGGCFCLRDGGLALIEVGRARRQVDLDGRGRVLASSDLGLRCLELRGALVELCLCRLGRRGLLVERGLLGLELCALVLEGG